MDIYMQFVFEVSVTVVGGLVLALIILFFRDYIFKVRDLSGKWIFELTTEVTSHAPYKGMTLTYLVLLAQEGQVLYGTGEKIKDIAGGKERKYSGVNRSLISIRGHIEKGYLRKSELLIQYAERAELRDSSTQMNLVLTSSDRLEGKFDSTIANSSGRVVWTRGTGGNEFASVADNPSVSRT